MRKRDKRAISGDKAELRVSMKFLERGWTAQKVTPDYGEDLMVRICDRNGASSPYIFFVQVKGMEEHKLTQERNQYDYSIENDHYESWMSFWQPMFLVVWDHSKGSGRWEWVQQPRNAPEEKITEAKAGPPATPLKVKQILGLPHELTGDGLQLMENMVRRHYHASVIREAIQEGLFAILEEDLKVHMSISGELGLYLSHSKSDVVMTNPSFGRFRDYLEPLLRKKRPAASDAEISALAEKVMSQHLRKQLDELKALDDRDSSAARQRMLKLIEAMNDAEDRLEVADLDAPPTDVRLP